MIQRQMEQSGQGSKAETLADMSVAGLCMAGHWGQRLASDQLPHGILPLSEAL